jgi:hypothetical protein
MLGKLFLRSLKRIAPTWTVEEAGNADTALKRITEEGFNVTFLTSICPVLISQCWVLRQCGRRGQPASRAPSVDYMRMIFLEAGDDGFMMKPPPCEKTRLQRALVKLPRGRQDDGAGRQSSQTTASSDYEIRITWRIQISPSNMSAEE